MKWILPLVLLAGMAGTAGTAQADITTLSAVNAERSAKGRAPLVWNDRLAAAARAHAADMARRGYFSHVAPNGARLVDRIARQGYRYCYASENIAQGQRGLSRVMRAWMDSKGHRKNILDRRAREIGVAEGPGRTWVMVLGAGC